MSKVKKILIIGGTGFLGYHLAKHFLKRNFKVISISRKKAKKSRLLKKVKYFYFDISKKKNFPKYLKKVKDISFLINAGGEVDHKNKKKVYQSHFLGVKNLVNYFFDKNLEKFVQIGSSLEYGKKNSPHYESFKVKPISNYAKAKSYATKYLLDLNQKTNFPVIVIRPYQVYGPRQDTNRLIPILINNSLKNKVFPCSNGLQRRDFLFVEDFIDGVFKLTIKKKISGEIFNIGSGETKLIKDVILLVRNVIKKGKPLFGKIKMRKEENMITYPNIDKIKKLIKWKYKVKFREGILKTISYYKK